MASIESEAYFSTRMVAVGISAGTITGIHNRRWKTLADFAFASSYVPGSGADTAFCVSVLEKLLGAQFEDHEDSPRLRRLYFEAHTLSIADLRRRTERTDSDLPLKLPAEERVVRLARVKARLTGFVIEGVFEPSHSLVDLLTQMLETSQLKYIPWSSCTSRTNEIMGIKKVVVEPSSIITDSSGYLKKQPVAEQQHADVSTDLLLTHALARRAVAFELANICTYETFATLTTRLLKEYMRVPLTKYNAVTLEQLENADRFVFAELASMTAGGLGVRPDGVFPVEESMAKILVCPEFQFLLMQMPGGSSSSSGNPPKQAATGDKKRGSSRSRSRKRKVTQQIEVNRLANIAAGKGKPAKGKSKGGKGKGSGKASQKGPFDASTEVGRMTDGSPICFAFNTGGCNLCAPGERCVKGFHVCWKIGCARPHSSHQHASSGQ